MGAFCYTMILLLATFLSSVASAKVVTLKEVGAINCPSHILKPEDLEKCTDKAIIEQITKKVMDTTNRDIEILRKEIKKIEEKITSHSHCKCNSCPKDCLDWKIRGYNSSGVYQVCPGNGDPIAVCCDMETDGGGWIVFQHRVDGSTDFKQNWNMYKQGFGSLCHKDFWLGFNKITRFMNVPNQLRIDLVAYKRHKNIKGHGKYNNFHISNESSYYKLNVSGFTGTIHDNLNCNSENHRSSGAPFSTHDQDHDNQHNKNCAQKYNGAGYWYNYCDGDKYPYTMLNGRYGRYGQPGGSDADHAYNGMYWYGWPADRTFKFKGIVESKMMFKRR